MTRRLPLAAFAALAVALAVAGCGSSKSGGSSAPAGSSSTASTSSSPSSGAAGGGSGGYGRQTTSTSASSSPASVSGGGQTLKLSADPGGALKFSASVLSAKSGRVTLRMTNPSSSGVSHGIAVEGHGVDKDGAIVQPGGTSTVTVTLKPGTYEFYCPFDGHKAAGMEGKLTVR